jgi:hypothetical protein
MRKEVFEKCFRRIYKKVIFIANELLYDVVNAQGRHDLATCQHVSISSCCILPTSELMYKLGNLAFLIQS